MKANLSCFENYLQLLFIEFAVLDITETWLNDSNYDLYHIENYDFVENHRTIQSGGGVGMFIHDQIGYKYVKIWKYLMNFVNQFLLK